MTELIPNQLPLDKNQSNTQNSNLLQSNKSLKTCCKIHKTSCGFISTGVSRGVVGGA
jgi:hypothetical protein